MYLPWQYYLVMDQVEPLVIAYLPPPTFSSYYFVTSLAVSVAKENDILNVSEFILTLSVV